LLKITFSLKIVGAIASIAPILTRLLFMIVKNCYSVIITRALMMGGQSGQLPTHNYRGVNDGWAEWAIANPCIIR
jgi:hypothetical protein